MVILLVPRLVADAVVGAADRRRFAMTHECQRLRGVGSGVIKQVNLTLPLVNGAASRRDVTCWLAAVFGDVSYPDITAGFRI